MTENLIHGELMSAAGQTRVDVEVALNHHTGEIELLLDRSGVVSEAPPIANLSLDPNDVRRLIEALHAQLGLLDLSSSASRQHYVDTGRYLTVAEVEEDDLRLLVTKGHGTTLHETNSSWVWVFNARTDCWLPFDVDDDFAHPFEEDVAETLKSDTEASVFGGFDEGAQRILATDEYNDRLADGDEDLDRDDHNNDA